MEKKLQKIDLKFYNLLIAQDLWQARYQILLIIYFKYFIDKCKLGYDDEKCETCGIRYVLQLLFSNMQTLKMI